MKQIFTTLAIMLMSMALHAQNTSSVPVYLDEKQPIEARVNDALSRMTLEEKVKLCHAQGKFYSNGVPRLGIPGLWSSDGPHGVRFEMNWADWGHSGWEIDSCTAFPTLTCLAATWNEELAYAYGKGVGEEARYRNKNVMLGPGVNIYRTPLNGRNFEYMGEDPYLAATLVVPYIKGVQSNGVASCVKHYCVNNQETNRMSVNVEVSERALREIYLPAFRAAVQEAGVWALMGAYNKIRGQHACHNEYTLQKILKGEWGFDGVVMSDWDGTHNAKEAAFNGLDIEMGTSSRPDKGIFGRNFRFDESYLGNDFLKGLRDGTYPMELVNDKARRVLRLIFRTAMNRQGFGKMDFAAHSEVVKAIGSEGVVLLQNNPVAKSKTPLLPMDVNQYQKILIVGDNATRVLSHGGQSSELNPQHETSVLKAFQDRYGDKIIYAQGYAVAQAWGGQPQGGSNQSDNATQLREEAVEKAKQADIVIYVGGLNKESGQDCEGSDRRSMGLSFGQNELITALLNANPRIVFVMMSGNAMELPELKRMPAILHAWYLGSDAGDIVADIVSGKVCPSGKLPFSYPVKLEDNGAMSFGAESYPGVNGQQTYKEDILVGYRWHDTKGIPALFPFGYGLSYTTFKYGKPSINGRTVSVAVTNTGKVEGKEVVQLYVGDDQASVLRPTKELKHFKKISLKPGETKTVEFTIKDDDLKFYDEASRGWKLEPGSFTLYIGSSSTDIRGKVKLNV